MDYGSDENGAGTDAGQTEIGGDFRVSYESEKERRFQEARRGGVVAGDHLYFIRIPDGPVKIGRSATPEFRMKTLQCASPYELQLLGTLKGGGQYEGTFHTCLLDHHIRGEWYVWAPLVIAAVEAALGDGRWRTVLGIEEPDDVDWWTGSPLYAPNTSMTRNYIPVPKGSDG